jgi:NADPH-dependent ferric siderophore reductase
MAFFLRATVTEVAPLTDRMRAIRLTGDPLRGLAWRPGQHVRVNVIPPSRWLRNPGDARRTYSIWDLDPESGVLDLAVLDHGDGPGSAWARTVRPGDAVTLSKPEGRLVLRDAGPHVFAGDETAAVPFAAMLRALPDDAEVAGVLEASSPAGEIPLPRKLSWAHDGQLLDAVRDLPATEGTVYIAGEARTCQAIRQHFLRDRRWPRGSIVVKPFWTPGRRGMD